MGALPGTVFRVESHGAVGVSPEWRGRLKQVKPPSVEGIVRANEFVSPIPGRWSGGWEREFSRMQLSACVTPSGNDCTTLTDLHYARDCTQGASFVLDARFTGSYLRVADNRVGASPPMEFAYGISSPNAGTVLTGSRSTAVAVLGQIAPAAIPFPGECGPPPSGEASISSQGVAFVRCQGGCSAALIASRKERRTGVVRRLPEQNALIVAPAAEMRAPKAALAQLGPGSIRLVVAIDGRRAAQRTMRLGVDR